MYVGPLEPSHQEALIAFLDEPGQGFCFCAYWFFDGPNDAWMACDPAENRASLRAALSRDEVFGVVATEEERVIAWSRLAPTAAVAKLGELEPSVREKAASLLCISVSEGQRGRGIARALLEGAISAARAAGFSELRAYPRWRDGLEAGEVWTGPRALFERAGFEVVHRADERWTLRLPL